MSVKKNLLRNTIAGILSKSSTTIYRLIQVPLVLSFLGVEDFGRWLVIYSIPSWLSFANMGFGSAASNEMSMAVSNEDFEKARVYFSTFLGVIVCIGLIGTIIMTPVSFFVPWYEILKAPASRNTEFSWTVFYLAINVFIVFGYEGFGGRFRAARKAHVGVMLASTLPWINLLSIYIALSYSPRFDLMALSQLISTIIFFIIYQWVSRVTMPQIYFSIKDVQFSRFRSMFRKGMAFQAFPLGYALIFQGNILIVQLVLGPAAVTVFGTVRTLVRTVNQFMEMINQAIWPELSHLFGKKDLYKAAKLHRVAVGASILCSYVGVIGLLVIGKAAYAFWVGKNIELSNQLLFLFLLPIPFNALWVTSGVVHMASNNHEGLAIRFLTATIFSAVACFVLSYLFGIEGAAVSTVAGDLILIPYVMKRSLMLTGDNRRDFTKGVLQEVKTIPSLIKSKLKRA